jgi:hypothetical protein
MISRRPSRAGPRRVPCDVKRRHQLVPFEPIGATFAACASRAEAAELTTADCAMLLRAPRMAPNARGPPSQSGGVHGAALMRDVKNVS